MTTPSRSVRAYRRLVALYPKKFRDEYGGDMVLLFEEMLHDLPPRRVWPRTLRDATSSIVVQRLESVMSKNSILLPLAFAAVAAAVLITASARGVNNMATFLVTVSVAGASIIAAFIYWQAGRPYVEGSPQLHRYWVHALGAGVALIGLVNVGSGFDLEVPWLLLFGSVILGVLLVAIGIFLGVWHGVDRLRTVRAA